MDESIRPRKPSDPPPDHTDKPSDCPHPTWQCRWCQTPVCACEVQTQPEEQPC